ncbi:hypothetical protein MF271_23560 (plasmid) [Deinococcus sp. KNUC1210]|uniref:cyclophilin-like fold protein n=1 Tax=Deinococcus sp. KNUC1210 TaxID=2917691 RepID=UPI001EF0888C|nr:cyclophilin-like fold protein [Deinococcus sp. KNUC1210]ULH17945.1 hypothetical protein MF271_23560 [Deinococcus sp. KNUC1210]
MNSAARSPSENGPSTWTHPTARLVKACTLAVLLICLAVSSKTLARSQQVKIKIGSTAFTATLDDSSTAKAFSAQLPMTIMMTELNTNEKFFDLPRNLPTRPSTPGTIQTGDLMLYGSRTLVLFYSSFTTTYSYTRLGRIHNPKGLAAALGTGNVTVTFEAR